MCFWICAKHIFAFDMCTVGFTTSYLLLPLFRHLFPSMPPRAPQGISRSPQPPEKAHIKHVLFDLPPGGPQRQPQKPQGTSRTQRRTYIAR